MKNLVLLYSLLLLFPTIIFAQTGVAINNDNSNPNTSAILDVKSIDQGVLVPRMTQVQRDAIVSPATSLMIFQLDGEIGFYYYDGTAWKIINGAFSTTSNVTSNAPGDYTTDDFVFGSPQLADDGNTAHDRRLFFDKSKAAFRAGYTTGTEWDDANVGTYSVGFGRQTTASGMYSFAGGFRSTASANFSFSFGQQTNASASYSTAFGFRSVASGLRSVAIGRATASGNTSVAIGNTTVASGDYSLALGDGTAASGSNSTAMGDGTTASGSTSTAMGSNTTASGASSTAMGQGTTASGNGSTAMGANTTASEFFSTAMGQATTASEINSTAMGLSTIASGITSTAMGCQTTASGFYSIAMGRNTTASGDTSTAMGFVTTASGNISTAMGYWTTASGNGSTAMGYQSTATSYVETAMGINTTDAISPNATTFVATDRLFTIGNGISAAAKSDALIIYKDGNATLAGTLTQSSDKNLKTDIHQLHGALANVMQLSGYNYYWKNKEQRGDKLQVGVIAQEVEALYPELVRKDGNGFLTVSYSGLVPVLIEATKEQQKQIEELKKDNKILKAQVQEVTALKAQFEASMKQLEVLIDNQNTANNH